MKMSMIILIEKNGLKFVRMLKKLNYKCYW